MPTSKSSTSSSFCKCCGGTQCSAFSIVKELEGYKAMLDELLAVIHRDGGQYTVLAGYEVSVGDAKYAIEDVREKFRRFSNQLRQLR